tara:strand:- start:30791 stop:32227 length:1437 start_codon:yes stop_codon:yes gene_type:complete
MRKIKILLLTCLVGFSFTSCFDDLDDNIIPASTLEINDFVWKGMNYVYLYKPEVIALADDNFASNTEYQEYLNGFESPEVLFESLKYDAENVDRFSRITDNYYELQNSLGGTSLSTGVEFNFYYVPGSSSEIFGAITLVLNNSVADNLGLERGQIFRGVNGEPLTLGSIDDLGDAIYQDSFTLNFADYDNNSTTEPEDDTVVLNGESASLSKMTYTENPVHKTEVLNVSGTKIGYLMYNGFTFNFNDELNNAFGEFSAAGVTELVIDLRYNGGGSVQTAAYLGSMVTGQFTGEVYSKTFHNENLQSLDTNYLFTNSINGGGTINSLNLSRVYVLTTNRRTASASELVINSLKPYIDVVVIGENTVGKTQASQTVYDSPSLFTDENVNLSHKYAMQPLIANSTNVNDQLVPGTGLIPDIEISESPSTFGILGDINEPLLAAAIANMNFVDRSFNVVNEGDKLRDVKHYISPLEQDMYID